MVGSRLEEVARLFGRQHDPSGAAAGQVEIERLGVFLGRPPGPVEFHDDPGGLGRRGNQAADLVAIDLGGPEAGIGEGLGEGAGQAAFGIVRQFLKIDIENLAELEQQPDGHRPLVMFDQIEIAGADPKLFGHLLLRQLPLLAQVADFAAQIGFSDRHAFADLDLQIYTAQQNTEKTIRVYGFSGHSAIAPCDAM